MKFVEAVPQKRGCQLIRRTHALHGNELFVRPSIATVTATRSGDPPLKTNRVAKFVAAPASSPVARLIRVVAPAPAQPPQLRIGLTAWVFAHTVKLIWRIFSAAPILDSPKRVETVLPAVNARMRAASAYLWAFVVPFGVAALFGPWVALPFVALGLWLLIRRRAAAESIPVRITDLVDAIRTRLGNSAAWRTVAIAAAGLLVVSAGLSFVLLTAAQVAFALAYVLLLSLAHSAVVSPVGELEGIDLDGRVATAIEGAATATNLRIAKLRKAGKDIEVP